MSKIHKSVIMQSDLPRLIALRRMALLENDDILGNEAVEAMDEAQAQEIFAETERVVTEVMEDARREAESLINEARREASQMLAEAQREAQHRQEEAYNQGFQTGYLEGQQRAKEENSELKEQAAQTLRDAQAEREAIIGGAEDELLKLAVQIAEKIIKREISLEPEIVQGIVKDAMSKVVDREEITVKVNPRDLDGVLEMEDEIRQNTRGIKNLRIHGDPSVEKGGCVIETDNGTVDARLTSQLEEVEQSLLDVRSHG